MKLGTIVRQLTARKVTMSNTVTTRYDNKALVTFFTLVIILSLAAEAYIVKGGPLWIYFVLMWIPAFSAIIASTVPRVTNSLPKPNMAKRTEGSTVVRDPSAIKGSSA